MDIEFSDEGATIGQNGTIHLQHLWRPLQPLVRMQDPRQGRVAGPGSCVFDHPLFHGLDARCSKVSQRGRILL